jgi:hypothetical protein
MGHEMDAAILHGFHKIGHYKMPVITQQGLCAATLIK